MRIILSVLGRVRIKTVLSLNPEIGHLDSQKVQDRASKDSEQRHLYKRSKKNPDCNSIQIIKAYILFLHAHQKGHVSMWLPS